MVNPFTISKGIIKPKSKEELQNIENLNIVHIHYNI